MTLGEWIRERLIEAGEKGVTCADLHTARKSAPELRYRGGTYNSFARFFHWYKQLGFIEETGEVEESGSKGGTVRLHPRRYYKITPKGVSSDMWSWVDPIGTVHVKWQYPARKYKYAPPSGRPVGRPSMFGSDKMLSELESPKKEVKWERKGKPKGKGKPRRKS